MYYITEETYFICVDMANQAIEKIPKRFNRKRMKKS